mgnify:CR=1 FL=1
MKRQGNKKRCSKCRKRRAISCFSKSCNRPDGFHPTCKSCVHDRYVADRQRIIRRVRGYQLNHKVERRAYMRRYYEENKELWDASRKDPARQPYIQMYRLAYYERNQEALRAAARQRYTENPGLWRAYGAARRARMKAVPGRFGPGDITMLFESQRGLCFYCGIPLVGSFDIDHKIPLARTELRPTNWPANLCCVCRRCNNQKKKRTADEYLVYWREHGLPINPAWAVP